VTRNWGEGFAEGEEGEGEGLGLVEGLAEGWDFAFEIQDLENWGASSNFVMLWQVRVRRVVVLQHRLCPSPASKRFHG
jgi:hypothetical protein